MSHLGCDELFVYAAAKQNAGVSLTNLVSTSFRDSHFFTCAMQPGVEALCPDPAQLIHEQEFSEWIQRTDCLNSKLRLFWQVNGPFAGIGLSVIYDSTYLFPGFRIRSLLLTSRRKTGMR